MISSFATGIKAFLVSNFVKENYGKPYIQIETTYSESDVGQIRVRIEAFLELLQSRIAIPLKCSIVLQYTNYVGEKSDSNATPACMTGGHTGLKPAGVHPHFSPHLIFNAFWYLYLILIYFLLHTQSLYCNNLIILLTRQLL